MMEVVTAKDPCITRVEDQDGRVFFYSELGVLRIIPQKGGMVRVSFAEDGVFCPEQGKDYADYTGSIPYEIREGADDIQVVTSEGTASVLKKTGAVSFYNVSGDALLRERQQDPRQVEQITLYKTVGGLQIEEIATADGMKKKVKAAEREACGTAYKTRIYYAFEPDEVLLGLGQGEHGEWNLRNTTYYGHQANRKIAIPFLVSSKNYGILLSTESLFLFAEQAGEAYIQTEADAYLDYYFLFGNDLFQVVRNYRRLTGKAAMLPAWTFGYIQSKERYESQEEILHTAEEFRRRGIGLDCMVLDWLSWPDGQWGQKNFDCERFPSPKEMTDRLHEMGVHFMMSIWPNMSEGTADHEGFQKAGLLLPGTDVYNAFSKEGRELYFSQLEQSLSPAGVDAWWCDSSEPIAPEWEHPMEPSDGEKYWEYKQDAESIMPLEQANAFGKYHALGIWEHQKACNQEKRVVNLTRSGWAGSQKYGTILWSGDISASWECLRNQVKAGLQMAASGMPYWTMDTGAFFVKKGRIWYWNGQYPEGIDDSYKKLYVRWLEYATFLPIFRAHGTDVDREPWAFGDAGDPYYEAICKTIRLRYQLLPYIYSVAAEVVLEDGMLIRPLLFDFGYDENVAQISDQYMFGPSLMVCPMVEEKDERSVYLPKGSGWYDFYTREYREGGNWITCESPLNQIPVFVKAGSIIPMKQPGLNSEAMKDAPMEPVVYPGLDARFRLYEDVGDGYKFENGEYTIKELIWNEEKQELETRRLGHDE